MAPVLALLGLFLCFWGGKLVRPALQIAALSAGALLGYWVGSHFSGPEVRWAIAAVGAVSAMILVILAFSAGMFILGALAAGAIYHGLTTVAGPQLLLPTWGIIVAAVGGGLLSSLLRKRLLKVLTAIVGGYVVVEAGVRVLDRQFYGWGASPEFALPVVKNAAWCILTFAGMVVQSWRSRDGGNR